MSNSADQLPSDLMDVLIKDPVKRNLILQLLKKENPTIRQELKTRTIPLKKQKRLHCESPTALQRRRALLEQQNRDSASESSSSDFSEPATQVVGPKLPFEELLQGVRAYVEVRRDNVDRSDGIKTVMRLMGATIKETFTNDVTHVVFKDGSFTTYEKAKLMKVHLVSVLWLDAIRRHNARVPEKNYPAFGNRVCDANVSILCSQIQKDYEDVIKDERRTRRHTMMASKTSMSSYMTAQNVEELPRSPELTSDDSDCGVVDGYTNKKSKNDILLSNSVMTDDSSLSSKKQNSSGDSTSLLSHVNLRNRRKTVNVISNMTLTPNIDEKKSSENVIDATPAKGVKSKKVLQDSTIQEMLTDSDKTKSGLFGSKQNENNSTGDKENCTGNTIDTSMSSLRVSERKSSESVNRRSRSSSNKERQSAATTMSSLRLSESPSKSTKSRSVSKLEEKESSTSVSSTDKEVEQIVRRRSRTKTINSNFNDSTSDNSKILDNLINGLESSSSKKKIMRSGSETSGSEFADKEDTCPKKKARRNLQKCPEFVNDAPRLRRRASSVMPQSCSISTRSSSRRSLSNDRSANNVGEKKSRKDRVSVVLTRIEINKETSKTSKKTDNAEQVDLSPSKKTRLEEKKTRKLYNPNEVTALSSIEDEKEREEYVKQKTQKSPDGVFLNPNKVLPVTTNNKKKQNSNVERSCDEVEIEKPTSTKRGKKKKEEVPNKRHSSADEQKELLMLLARSENRTKRLEKLSLSQPKSTQATRVGDTISSSSLPITPIKRRSTLDFVSLTQSQQKRKFKLDPKRTSSIVCTKMHRYEVVNFENIVNKLGRFFVEDQVTGKTSHLVAGECKRTINMLRAIARGCWILNHEWLLKSAEEGRWLNEEDYELTEFSPAVQQCRLQRVAFGPLFTMDVFKDCGYIYVGKNTSPKTADLKELIAICQGRVTNLYRNANISVGEFHDRPEITCVTEAWVLDSIYLNRLKSMKSYLIKPQGNGSPCV